MDYRELYDAGIVFFCVSSDEKCQKAYKHDEFSDERPVCLRTYSSLRYDQVLDFDEPSSLKPFRKQCTKLVDELYKQHKDAILEAFQISSCYDGNDPTGAKEGFFSLQPPKGAQDGFFFGAKKGMVVKDGSILVDCGLVSTLFGTRYAQKRIHLAKRFIDDEEKRYVFHTDANNKWRMYRHLDRDELGRALLLSALAGCAGYGNVSNAKLDPIAAHLQWLYMLGRTTHHLPSRLPDASSGRGCNPQVATGFLHANTKTEGSLADLQRMPEKAIRCSNNNCYPNNLYYARALSAFSDKFPTMRIEGWILTSDKTWNIEMWSIFEDIKFTNNSPGELMLIAKHAIDPKVEDVVQWGKQRWKQQK